MIYQTRRYYEDEGTSTAESIDSLAKLNAIRAFKLKIRDSSAFSYYHEETIKIVPLTQEEEKELREKTVEHLESLVKATQELEKRFEETDSVKERLMIQSQISNLLCDEEY